MIRTVHIFLFSLFALLLYTAVPVAFAQQTDTSRTEKKLKYKKRSTQKTYQTERSTGENLSSDGSYNVPEPTKYYQAPFNGQKSLDRAVEAYRKEVSQSRFFELLDKIAPYINNQFEFGVYQIEDLPIVSRDNPLFKSYKSKAKRE